MNLQVEKSQLSTTSLTILKKCLPKGAYELISKEFDISKSTVSRILDGKIENIEVIEFALKLAIDKRNRIDALATKIDLLV